MRILLIISFVILALTGFGQGNGKGGGKGNGNGKEKNKPEISVHDSLNNVWEDATQPIQERAEAGRSLARMLKNTSPAQAITLLEDIEVLVGDEQTEADLATYMLKSGAYRTQGNYPLALEEAQNALSLAEKLGSDNGIANAYNSIGQTYERQEDFEKSLEYHNKALDINLELGNPQRIGKNYSNIGNINGQMGRYSNALASYETSLGYLKKAKDRQGESMIYGNMGFVYSLQGDSVIAAGGSQDEARTYYLISIQKSMKAKDYFDRSGNTNFALNAKNNIGLVYTSMQEYGTAIALCQSALSESIEQGIVPMERDACNCLSAAYKGQGKTEQALLYFERYVHLRDSLVNMDEQRIMLEKELSYNYEKQATLAADLHAQELEIQQQEADRKAFIRNVTLASISIGAIVLLVFFIFLYNRFKVTREQNVVINAQKEDLAFQKDLVDHKNAEIMDSIVYARRFQSAILPSEKEFLKHLPQSFILYKPKDIVAGDFYWMERVGERLIFAVADCTGHGVPGAMVSLVCNAALNRSVREYGLTDPAAILNKTREILSEEFEDGADVKDGMDIALCSLELNSSGNARSLVYAGAHNPLWILRADADEMEEVKANKQPIGQFDYAEDFVSHQLSLNKGDSIFLFSDGYVDQFGGEKGKKFKTANFKKLLISLAGSPMGDQQKALDDTLEDWKGNLEQVDDICIIGVRI